MICNVKKLIFDLDGLIIDTESLCAEVASQVLAEYGKTLTPEVYKVVTGKRPLECWADVAQLLDIDEDPQVLVNKSEPLLAAKWADARLLPGALRLLQYARKHHIPFAIATSTSRATFNKKMSKKRYLKDMLTYVVCGDEVMNGKPFPDVFLEAARLMGAQPCDCLVLEDAPSGVEGATQAGMRVVVVPSLVNRNEYPTPDPECSSGVCQILPSLLAFDPTAYGLPPFDDLVHGVIPMDHPIKIKGTVVKGFGRGSKELGIPTANVDSKALSSALAEAVTGIYTGWASIGNSSQVYKMVMSIGWNPFYQNTEKTAEPWILHEFSEPFYGSEIRLLLAGYVRPEQNFSSLQALIDRIRMDGEVSQQALEHPTLLLHQHDDFLCANTKANGM